MLKLYREKILHNFHEIEGNGMQTYDNVEPKTFLEAET
jgi:hypothetical protein